MNAAPTKGGSFTTLGDFEQTYGRGTGGAISSILSGLGTGASQAMQLSNQATMDAAQKQWANQQAQMAAAGVNPAGSSANLAWGDFASTVNAQMAAQNAALAENEQSLLLSNLTGEAQLHGQDVSTMQNVLKGIGTAADIAGGVAGAMTGVGAIAGGVSEAFGIGGKTGSVLDMLGKL